MKRTVLLCISLLLAGVSCGPGRKLRALQEGQVGASLQLSAQEMAEEMRTIRESHRDTITVEGDNGETIFIMKAYQDESDGEMVATEVLDAVVVTAKSRSVAERHGMVDIRFEVRVPAQMQDRRWQLRFYPDMYIQDDSIRLEPVIITGDSYRKAQLRGYEQYNRFLGTIISDTTRFIDLHQLEVFLERNIPDLYRFKSDSSFVSDELFLSFYGVTEKEAIDHYTNLIAVRMNRWRRSRMEKMYNRYVKVPIMTEGIRLDTVISSDGGDFIYTYTETVATRPGLRKIDIILRGEIYESDQQLYAMTPTPPLTFYISSLSSFVDESIHYLTRVVERRAEANTACYIDFARGKADIDPGMGKNREEIDRISRNIFELLENNKFDLDSIVISAGASPEGSVKSNDKLSSQRAASVAGYFEGIIRHYRDSVLESLGNVMSAEGSEGILLPGADIRFISRSGGENWEMLSMLVDRDTVMTEDDIRAYMRHLSVKDLDKREAELQKEPFYEYMSSNLYPRLRTVRFDFFLHRKGMIKDTLHTTEPDTLYMQGVSALKNRDYLKALEILRPYRDYNSAVALTALDYNATAMSVLEDLEKTAPVKYLMAILYARSGDDQMAVQYYLEACREEHSYVFRGKLDPELFILIKRYGLDNLDNE